MATLAATGSLGVAFWWRRTRRLRRPPGPPSDAAFAPDGVLRILADDTVHVVAPQVELGQGVHTGLALIVADALDADWATVRVTAAPVHPAYAHPGFRAQFTAGSVSVMAWHAPLRAIGERARRQLVAAAAERWGVPAGECETAAGTVHHPASGRRARYGELAEAASRQSAPRWRDVPPRGAPLVGREGVARLEGPEIVTGRRRYGADAAPAGALTVTVLRPPRLGDTLAGFDATRALGLPGAVAAFAVSSGVAVAARDTWTALRARDAVEARWRTATGGPLDEARLARLLADAVASAAPGMRRGDVAAALRGAARRLELTCTTAPLAHAAIEPLVATARLAGGRCEVWVPTQAPGPARDEAARTARLPTEAVTVHTTAVGGGFGRRLSVEMVREAVECAAALPGETVRVQWSRDDDLRCGRFRGPTRHHLVAGLADDGTPVAWRHALAGCGTDGAVTIPYRLGALEVLTAPAEHGLPTGLWRAVEHGPNAFAIESMIDALAALAGRDALAFRLRLLDATDPRRRVLEAAAGAADWGRATAPDEALGLALHSMAGSHCAVVAHVERRRGHVRVRRLTGAIDCGLVIHPDGVRQQVEGAMLMGASAALAEAVHVRDGVVREANYDGYRLLRTADAPQLRVVLMASDRPPSGVGEVALPPTAPAIANALARLGPRPTALPLLDAPT